MRPLLALFVRALRQTTRAPSTYLLRGAIALAILLFLWATHTMMRWSGAPGQRFFVILVVANYLFVTLVGLGSFASAIAEEKEEGTLGLLRMADVNPLALLFGKSTSRLGSVLLLLSIQVPFAFLAVTMGGVALNQILTAFALLTSYLFALANVSLFFSVTLPKASRAAIMTAGLLLVSGLFCLFPTMIAERLVSKYLWSEFDGTVQSLRAAGEWLCSVHPAYHLATFARGGYLSLDLSRSLLTHVGIGIAFFILSLLVFERYCGSEASYTSTGEPGSRWFGWLGRPRRPRSHAIAWKDFHFALGGRISFGIRLVCYVAGVFVLLKLNNTPVTPAQFADCAWDVGWTMWYLELTFCSLLVWGPEAWGQHVGTLFTTPTSLARMNLQKTKAVFMAILPSLILIVLALGVGGSSFVDLKILGPWRPSTGPDIIHAPFGLSSRAWMLLQYLQTYAQFGLFLALIINLSLRLKWAALPAALGIFLFVQFTTGMLSMLSFFLLFNARAGSIYQLAAPLFSAALAGLAIFFLLRNTHKLLLRRAAEG